MPIVSILVLLPSTSVTATSSCMSSWNWQKRMYLWYCAAAYVSFLLVFVGVASSAWASGGPEGGQWGLLASCKHDYVDYRHDCQAFQFRHMPSKSRIA